MLVMSMSHTCCSLASMKAFPYFCSHSRRPRRVQMLKNPTSSLDEMLFRNHSWNRDALEGQEPPQQCGRDRQKGLTMTDPHRLVPPTHSRPSSPCCLPAQSKALQLWCYLSRWCRRTKFIKPKSIKRLWDWLCTTQWCSSCQNPWHANTSLVVNAYAPAGQELAHRQSESPNGKHKLPGAIFSHFRSQAIKKKSKPCVQYFLTIA